MMGDTQITCFPAQLYRYRSEGTLDIRPYFFAASCYEV